MTIPGFGRIMPIHGMMLELAGYNLDPLEFDFDPLAHDRQQIPDDARRGIIRRGHAALVAETKSDFGYDLSAWQDFLIANEEFGYTHPYAYDSTRRYIHAAINDAIRNRLVTELEHGDS